MRSFFLPLALLALVPAAASAQICVGQPALNENSSGSVGFGAAQPQGFVLEELASVEVRDAAVRRGARGRCTPRDEREGGAQEERKRRHHTARSTAHLR